MRPVFACCVTDKYVERETAGKKQQRSGFSEDMILDGHQERSALRRRGSDRIHDYLGSALFWTRK